MITGENYEQMLLKYQQLKEFIYEQRLTKGEFLFHIQNKTTIGLEIKSRLISICGEENYDKELASFVEIMYPAKG